MRTEEERRRTRLDVLKAVGITLGTVIVFAALILATQRLGIR